MIHTLVIFQVVAGRAAEFEAGHRELIALMGDQPGCIAIRAHRSLNNPLEYMVYGSWKDKEAWERAHQAPRFKDLFKRLPLVEHTLSRSHIGDRRPAILLARRADMELLGSLAMAAGMGVMLRRPGLSAGQARARPKPEARWRRASMRGMPGRRPENAMEDQP